MFRVDTAKIEEKIVKQAYVSNLKSNGLAGGILYLTEKRVFFKSNDSEFKTYQLDFPFNSSFKCKSFSVLGLIKNAMTIYNGVSMELFFLDDKKNWLAEIEKIQNQSTNQTGNSNESNNP